MENIQEGTCRHSVLRQFPLGFTPNLKPCIDTVSLSAHNSGPVYLLVKLSVTSTERATPGTGTESEH